MPQTIMRRLLVLLFLSSAAIAQSGPVNLGFESGEAGALPEGWKATTPRGDATTTGYTAKLTRDQAKQGSYCAELASEAGASGFGNLMQSFEATAYRGKRVRFRAAVRTGGQMSGRGQLWLRVDRQGGETGFFILQE